MRFRSDLILSTLLAIALVFGFISTSQAQANYRSKQLFISSDTTTIDSLSIVPNTVQVTGLESNDFRLLYAESKLIVTNKEIQYPITVSISYKTFSFSFLDHTFHKDTNLLLGSANRVYNPFRSDGRQNESSILNLGGLEKRGSVSRGITVGNNQNLGVNSSLNLQLSGALNERFSLLAAIADENIPIQPEGNTQQLQDFDQVYIQVYDETNRFTAGDFQVSHNDGYFMRFNKKLQGGRVESVISPVLGDTNKQWEIDAGGAVSRGKFSRQIIQGREGNQGPYQLRGAENERFIVVLSGTERIYVDGRLLTRGQENDYVIDYNTAQLTFTAKQPITKDRRIVAEFQYSDRNYARSMIYGNTALKTKRSETRFSIFSEQDAKNQFLQQDLTSSQRAVLETIGDSLDRAVAPAVDTVAFNENQILYARVDTIYYDPVLDDSIEAEDVYVYSTNPEVANYQLTFSEVGEGNGDYVFAENLAFGRRYQWVAPVDGQSQGNYAPVILLVTPKRRQMLSLSGKYELTENLVTTVELAGTNTDVNTFSSADSKDNLGFAGKFNIEGKQPIAENWKLVAGLDYEFVHQYFDEIERFRPVEFDRDWNIRGLEIPSNQNVTSASAGFDHVTDFTSRYTIKSFVAGNSFSGLQHAVNMQSSNKHIRGTYEGSYSNIDGQLINSRYLRQRSNVQVPVWRTVLGWKDDFERNRQFDPQNDTLLSRAYQWYEWEASVSNEDTAQNRHKVFYAQRNDKGAQSQRLKNATLARMYGYQLDLKKYERSSVFFTVNYRTLDILDSNLTNERSENTLIGRLEYQLRLFQGALSSVSFYELGSGQELRREFVYISTVPGQGTHIHIDYNGDGEKQLNEFEQAVLADQIASANFIKVFVPTDEFIRVLSNQFSQSLYLRPAAVWRNEEGLKEIVSHFSNQFNFVVERKTLDLEGADRFNPFVFDIPDTLLQSITSNLRNIFYFNQSHPVFGANVNFQRLDSRNLLTSGFESRATEKYGSTVRWNITKTIGLETNGEQGFKTSQSDAGVLSSRNFNIFFREIEPKISIQPGVIWRITFNFKYEEQFNLTEENPLIATGGETSIARTLGLEFYLNSPDKGSLLLNANAIQANYNGAIDSPVGFEMLDGLQPGLNATWGLSYSRTLANNLQISVNYNGRQSPGLRIIHTGGLQARAFF